MESIYIWIKDDHGTDEQSIFKERHLNGYNFKNHLYQLSIYDISVVVFTILAEILPHEDTWSQVVVHGAMLQIIKLKRYGTWVSHLDHG